MRLDASSRKIYRQMFRITLAAIAGKHLDLVPNVVVNRLLRRHQEKTTVDRLARDLLSAMFAIDDPIETSVPAVIVLRRGLRKTNRAIRNASFGGYPYVQIFAGSVLAVLYRCLKNIIVIVIHYTVNKIRQIYVRSPPSFPCGERRLAECVFPRVYGRLERLDLKLEESLLRMESWTSGQSPYRSKNSIIP